MFGVRILCNWALVGGKLEHLGNYFGTGFGVSVEATTTFPVLIAPSLRVSTIVPSLRVSTISPTPFQPRRNCTLPNIIEMDDNHDPTFPSSPRYPLRSRDAARHVPVCYSATGAHCTYPTCLLISSEAHHTAQPPITLVANDAPCTTNYVIDEVNGHSLEYRHLIQGPNKDI